MRVTYIYRQGRSTRLSESRDSPTEFFYGYQQLKRLGIVVAFMEDKDIGVAPPLPLLSQLINKFSRFLWGFPLGMTHALLTNRGCRKLEGSDCVVATTNGIGMALATAKAMGHINEPILFIVMGLLPENPTPMQLKLFDALLKHTHVACISKGEQALMQRLLPNQKVNYIPFGVDVDFWCPAPSRFGSENYVLAIGNDNARDWDTLVQAWRQDFPKLKIVTNLPVPSHGGNVEVIQGDWRTCIVPDSEIRDLYRGANFVVIPLRDTIQPSGQSVCLQSMACGKAVILSNTVGVWDNTLLVHGETVLLSPPGDVAALSDLVRLLLLNPSCAEEIGDKARKLVVSSFNTEIMANAIYTLIEGLSVCDGMIPVEKS